MSVLSKAVENIVPQLLCKLICGKYEGDLSVGGINGLSAKAVITIDLVESREEKSKSGIDIWIAFSFGVIRINFDIIAK